MIVDQRQLFRHVEGEIAPRHFCVVIIEDNPDDCDMIRRYILRDAPSTYVFREACTGSKGIALCLDQSSPPDCVVLDMNLPDMNGLEIIRALSIGKRELPFPIIVLTGDDGDARQGREALALGAQDFLGKAWITPESLSRAVANAVERFRLTKTVRENEHFLQRITDVTPGVLHVFDLEMNRSVFINRSVASVLGYTADEVQKMGADLISALMHPDDVPRFEEHMMCLRELNDNEVADFEHRMRDRLGKWHWFQSRDAVFARDERGAARQIIGTAIEITERKCAEKALRESEFNFRSMFESSGVGKVEWEIDGGSLTRVNKRFCDLLGYTAEELTNEMTYLEITHPNDRATHVVAIIDLQDNVTGSFEVEKRYIRKDGTAIWVQATGTLLRDETGKRTRMLGSAHDITARKLAEEALRDVDRRKDEFLATLAHELRNPLAPIRNAVQILQMKEAEPPELHWATGVIDRQMQAMTRLIDDLMDISRISQGKLDLKRELIDLEQVIQGAVETSRPLIDQKGHEFTLSMPAGPVILNADFTRLVQVFLNLLNNSAKYMDPGGRISLFSESDGNDVLVSITDTGIGIPLDKLPTIFEMFSQVEGSLSRSQGGLGIGLSLVKRLVEMHGGQIGAESDGPGKGSKFTVRLPIAVENVRTDSIAQECETTNISGLRILVVDDNQDAASTAMILLQMMGNDVCTAADGEEALKTIKSFDPDVVLLDIGLPKMNGYEVAKAVRRQSWGKHIVLVAVTGWGQDDDQRKSKDAGFDQHMVKPVDPKSIMELLSNLHRTLPEPAKRPGITELLV
jgi:PAS domain S-box-containing protein